ncbi:MAG: methyltransferase domain-containing protein [Acidobacteriia bacterium]|nr:methyltransferase domain-containing protein [Terriglobia bacterium]
MAQSTKTDLTFTGERFVPGEGGARIAYEHYHRYYFAQSLARGKVVLDLGCGEGYGSNLLAEVAERVTGIDLSAEAVEHARGHYSRENLDFKAGDCRKTGLPDQKFDLIVCFEIIEHIAEHEELLTEVRRVLKPEGVFVISSPDKEFYSDAEGYANPFHVKELYARDFQALLERQFPEVLLFSQGVGVGSVIRQDSPGRGGEPLPADLLDVKPDPDRGFNPAGPGAVEAKYIVAVCSTVPLDPSVRRLSFSLWNDKSETLLRELEDSLRELQSLVKHLEEAIGDRDNQILRLGKAVEEKSIEISKLKLVVSEKDEVITRREADILSWDAHTRDLEQTIQVLRDFETKIKGTLHWRIYNSLVRPVLRLFRRSGSASH